MSIPSISPLNVGAAAQTPAKATPAGATERLGQTFAQALDNLSQTQGSSDALLQKLAAGENVDVHQVMIATEQTDISFRVAMAMRDRLVDAYHEVMRMSV